jgi:hypothetical protein
MKPVFVFALIAAIALGLGWSYQEKANPTVSLARYAPAGALLYLEARNLSLLLTDWNAAPEKRAWIASSNYEVFSRSRLLLRLQDAGKQFALVAGLPPDMNLLSQVAGSQSALALYDIGKLQFVYITRRHSDDTTQNRLWQTRGKFETRNAGGITFYLRRDSESQREVEFALTDEYLLLATREDLMASALQLLAGGNEHALESDPWFVQAVAGAGQPGDLRMVLNLDKIVPSPYFRSYWVHQNISEMKTYSAAVSDLFRSGKEYREERVLLKKASQEKSTQEQAEDINDLVRLVPDSLGFYEARLCSSIEPCVRALEMQVLAAQPGTVPSVPLAPEVALTTGEAGSIADLEERIDQAPSAQASDLTGLEHLKSLLQANQVKAMLHAYSTENDNAGVFVRIHSVVVLAGTSDWNEMAVRNALTAALARTMTTGELGVGWKKTDSFYELDGMHPLAIAMVGKYMLVADTPALIRGVLGNLTRKPDSQPLEFVAEFNHNREKDNFSRLITMVDRPELDSGRSGSERQPQFLSENILSLSSTLAEVSSEKITVRDAGDKVLQTVTYQWSR